LDYPWLTIKATSKTIVDSITVPTTTVKINFASRLSRSDTITFIRLIFAIQNNLSLFGYNVFEPNFILLGLIATLFDYFRRLLEALYRQSMIAVFYKI
jgi:hypothetical protein